MSKKESPEFDSPMTDTETEIVDQLSESDLELIDGLIVANVGETWMNSAFVIGGIMLKVPDEYEELPDVFYSSRLTILEQKGVIGVRGDLRSMKHCEIQLSK